jgi:putative glutamine amidotransferase
MAHPQPPIIGITCTQIDPPEDQGRPRFGLSETYVRAVAAAGGAPLLIPLLTEREMLRALYERLDGLLLSGGGDIDPCHFGETVHESCRRILPDRDDMELALVRWAAEEHKPLLGICRGIQVLNVALGGSLYQDIPSQFPEALAHTPNPAHPREEPSHPVSIRPGTHLARILGASSLAVNSFHHQSLKDLAPGLSVTAQAPDGVVEAVELAGHPFALGVQWHPEEMADLDFHARRLFSALTKAAGP